MLCWPTLENMCQRSVTKTRQSCFVLIGKTMISLHFWNSTPGYPWPINIQLTERQGSPLFPQIRQILRLGPSGQKTINPSGSVISHLDSKIDGANMGHTWGLSVPGGPHDGPMNLVIRAVICVLWCDINQWYLPFARAFVTWAMLSNIHHCDIRVQSITAFYRSWGLLLLSMFWICFLLNFPTQYIVS